MYLSIKSTSKSKLYMNYYQQIFRLDVFFIKMMIK